MASTDPMPTSLQENVITLLCFSDSAVGIVSGVVQPELFDSALYRRIATVASDYYARHGEAPKAHIGDLLEDDLNRTSKQANLLSRVLQDVHDLWNEGVNEEYVLGNLRKFVRGQKMKAGIVEAASLLQQGELERAESTILDTVRDRDAVFEPGLRLSDAVREIRNAPQVRVYRTGIRALDHYNIGPSRKALFLFMAPTNRGKTWALMHFGKHCLLQRLKVLHITLEMSEMRILTRYVQGFTAMFDRGEGTHRKVQVTRLQKGPDGEYEGFDVQTQKRRVLMSKKGLGMAEQRLHKLTVSHRLVVKEFPTSTLTVENLYAYMDMLERHDRFVPDVLVVDYPDLMDIDPSQLRVDTGRVYKQLRGLAVERNIAVIAATQTNKEGGEARLVTLKHMAEDYSKAMTADTVVTYNQTKEEKDLGLARLFVAKERDEQSGMVCVVSQSYSTGQFHLDSAPVTDNKGYLRQVQQDSGDEDTDR